MTKLITESIDIITRELEILIRANPFDFPTHVGKWMIAAKQGLKLIELVEKRIKDFTYTMGKHEGDVFGAGKELQSLLEESKK